MGYLHNRVSQRCPAATHNHGCKCSGRSNSKGCQECCGCSLSLRVV